MPQTLRLPDSDCHDEIRLFIRRPDGSEDILSLDSRHKSIEIADADLEDDVEILAGFVLSSGQLDGKPTVLKARVPHATPEPIKQDQARPDQPAVSSEPAQPVSGDAAEPAAEGNRNGEADCDTQAVSEASVEQVTEPAPEPEAAESASLKVMDNIGISDHLFDAEPPIKAFTSYEPLPRKKNKQ